jgi:hypothetical protein
MYFYVWTTGYGSSQRVISTSTTPTTNEHDRTRYLNMYVYVFMYLCIYRCKYIYIYIYIYIYMYIYIYYTNNKCTWPYKVFKHTCVNAYVFHLRYGSTPCFIHFLYSPSMYVIIYTYVLTYTYIHLRAYMKIYIFIYDYIKNRSTSSVSFAVSESVYRTRGREGEYHAEYSCRRSVWYI